MVSFYIFLSGARNDTGGKWPCMCQPLHGLVPSTGPDDEHEGR